MGNWFYVLYMANYFLDLTLFFWNIFFIIFKNQICIYLFHISYKSRQKVDTEKEPEPKVKIVQVISLL